MNDKTNIWFVNSHSKGNGRTDNLSANEVPLAHLRPDSLLYLIFIIGPLSLNIRSVLILETGMIRLSRDSTLGQILRASFALRSRKTIDNATEADELFAETKLSGARQRPIGLSFEKTFVNEIRSIERLNE